MNAALEPRPAQPAEPPRLDGFEVLDACHRETLIALDRLQTMLECLAGRWPGASARVLAAEVQRHFSQTARRHHDDEERYVFPPILQGRDTALKQTVLCLQQDHFWLEEDWRELEPMLDAIVQGHGWVDLDVLREAAAIFIALSREHILLEESCIYPAARSRLDPNGRGEMVREMSARRRRAVSALHEAGR